MSGWPPYLLHATMAGTAIAAACGLIGYFVVLRSQVFTGEALSHAAFTGALAALAAGLDLRLGLFTATIATGLIMNTLARHGHATDVTIGTTLAWVLGLGVFFLTLFTTGGGQHGNAGVTVLFGSIFGISAAQAILAAGLAAAIVLAQVSIARPLLFASLDPLVARARGIPVRSLNTTFLILLGTTAGEASQAVGALLLVGLLAAPAGTAHRLTTHPYSGLVLAGLLAITELWAGLVLQRHSEWVSALSVVAVAGLVLASSAPT